MPCNNNSIKNQSEFWLYYTLLLLGEIGKLKIDDTVIEYNDFENTVLCMPTLHQTRLADNIDNTIYARIADKALGENGFTIEVYGTQQTGDTTGAVQDIDAAAGEITLDTGEGVGFTTGDIIKLSGTTANDGLYKVLSVATDVVTIDKSWNDLVADQATIAGTMTLLHTEEVTFDAYMQVGQAKVVPNPTNKWASIDFANIKAGETITGSEGASVEIVILPQDQDYTPGSSTTKAPGNLINFDNGFTMTPGTTSRAVPNKFDPVDHYKRTRGENTISVAQFYQTFGESLQYLRDRDFLLKAEVHEDGASTVTETYLLNKVRLNVPLSVGADGADVTQDSDGNFRDYLVI